MNEKFFDLPEDPPDGTYTSTDGTAQVVIKTIDLGKTAKLDVEMHSHDDHDGPTP